MRAAPDSQLSVCLYVCCISVSAYNEKTTDSLTSKQLLIAQSSYNGYDYHSIFIMFRYNVEDRQIDRGPMLMMVG